MNDPTILEKALKCCRSPSPYSEPQLKVQCKEVPFMRKSKKKKNSISHKISLKEIPSSKTNRNIKRKVQPKLVQNRHEFLPSGRNAISSNVSIKKLNQRNQGDKIAFLWSPFRKVEKMKKKGVKLAQAKKIHPVKTYNNLPKFLFAKKDTEYSGQSTRQKSPDFSVLRDRRRLGESKYTLMSGKAAMEDDFLVQQSTVMVDYFNPEKINLLKGRESK